MKVELLQVVRQGRVRNPQLCSNRSVGSLVLQGDLEQFLADGCQVELFPARVPSTFAAQVYSNDASVLLLLVSFPHGRDILHVAKGKTQVTHSGGDVPRSSSAAALGYHQKPQLWRQDRHLPVHKAGAGPTKQ